MPKDRQPQYSEVPYGPPIQQAIASGDLAKMKAVAAQAQQFVNEYGDVSAMLQILKIEIAKLEARGK